jgi:hypothetical protein
MEWLMIIGAVFVPVVLSLLGELLGVFLKFSFPRTSEWWAAGGGRKVRLWGFAIGGLVSACILVVIGLASLSETTSATWVLVLAVVPGFVGLVASVVLIQEAATDRGYRRSNDGSWSVGD